MQKPSSVLKGTSDVSRQQNCCVTKSYLNNKHSQARSAIAQGIAIECKWRLCILSYLKKLNKSNPLEHKMLAGATMQLKCVEIWWLFKKVKMSRDEFTLRPYPRSQSCWIEPCKRKGWLLNWTEEGLVAQLWCQEADSKTSESLRKSKGPKTGSASKMQHLSCGLQDERHLQNLAVRTALSS